MIQKESLNQSSLTSSLQWGTRGYKIQTKHINLTDRLTSHRTFLEAKPMSKRMDVQITARRKSYLYFISTLTSQNAEAVSFFSGSSKTTPSWRTCVGDKNPLRAQLRLYQRSSADLLAGRDRQWKATGFHTLEWIHSVFFSPSRRELEGWSWTCHTHTAAEAVIFLLTVYCYFCYHCQCFMCVCGSTQNYRVACVFVCVLRG